MNVVGSKSFGSSNKDKNGGFHINNRMIYGVRSCGLGYNCLEKFHIILYLPPPLSRTNYDITANLVLESVKDVTNKPMKAAADEINQLKEKDGDRIANCAVSSDGTWQKRGFSSLTGVYAVIPMDTGKIFDVEPMSCYCKIGSKNKLIETSDPAICQVVKASHKCRANFQASVPNMETVGAGRVFERSIHKNKLRYSEFFGDGDSKGFPTVENIYQGIKVKKIDEAIKICADALYRGHLDCPPIPEDTFRDLMLIAAGGVEVSFNNFSCC